MRFAVVCVISAAVLSPDLSRPVAEETFNRSLIAVVTDAHQAYIGWRLSKSDPADVGFNVYRRTAGR